MSARSLPRSLNVSERWDPCWELPLFQMASHWKHSCQCVQAGSDVQGCLGGTHGSPSSSGCCSSSPREQLSFSLLIPSEALDTPARVRGASGWWWPDAVTSMSLCVTGGCRSWSGAGSCLQVGFLSSFPVVRAGIKCLRDAARVYTQIFINSYL